MDAVQAPRDAQDSNPGPGLPAETGAAILGT